MESRQARESIQGFPQCNARHAPPGSGAGVAGRGGSDRACLGWGARWQVL